MKKFLFTIIALLGASFMMIQAPQIHAEKAWPSGNVDVSAAGAVVMDLKSGTVLYNKNMNSKRYPASITKIMTTLLALENSSPNETVTYSTAAVMGLEQGASNAGIQPGENLTMEQSLYCVMLPSANEACNGVAEHICGSVKNFVNEMNNRAKALGCTGTHFNNPNGLWMSNHYTTPYDMALIMREAMKNETFRQICSTRRYDIPKTNKSKKRSLVNHHQMIYPIDYPQYDYEYCIGGKTGYTSKSLATLVTCAKKGSMELVCVVMKTNSAPMGEPNIYTDTIKLFNYCFEKYSQYDINSSTTDALTDTSIFSNFTPFFNSTTTGLSLDGDGSVILPRGVTLDKAAKNVELYAQPQTTNGKKVIGKITYTYNGKEAGGAQIVYNQSESPTLTDSIDMSEWYESAVEEANTPDFPWKKLILVILLAAVIMAGVTVLVIRFRDYQEKHQGHKRYKRLKKKDNNFFHRK